MYSDFLKSKSYHKKPHKLLSFSPFLSDKSSRPRHEASPGACPPQIDSAHAHEDREEQGAIRPRLLRHLGPALGPAQLADLFLEERVSVLQTLGAQCIYIARRLQDAGTRDAPPGGEGFRGVRVEEPRRLGDDGFEVEIGGQLGEREVQHVGLVVLEELVAAAQDDLREDVEGEDLLARDQGIEEARYVAVPLDVVGEHGQCVGEGEVRLVAREVGEERGVGVAESVWDQPELGYGGGKRGEHEVSYAQHGETGHCWCSEMRGQHEEEHLAYVVVALEVAEVGLLPQNLGDQV